MEALVMRRDDAHRCGVTKLSIATRRLLDYATGYLTLGMKAEAAEALAEIVGDEREALPVLRLRSFVHVERKEWAEAAVLLTTLCEQEPDEAGHWIQLAYAMRRHRDIGAARLLLRRGLELHPGEPTIHFNLACYEAQLGRLDEARAYLAVACRLDEDYVEMAKTDPDLAPLR